LPIACGLAHLTAMTLEERLQKFLSQDPRVDPSAYVAPSAVVMGAVRIAPLASVWPLCVLRGDIESIEIGEGSNVQDGTIVHLADDLGVKVGSYVTIGHAAMIHACTIEDECLIGMRATVLDGAVSSASAPLSARAPWLPRELLSRQALLSWGCRPKSSGRSTRRSRLACAIGQKNT
jgi:carbonic anhydrase/acetyltransferase-like protein (isoleucine patch superfamily)